MNGLIAIDKCSILNLKNINRFYLLRALRYHVTTTIYVQLEFEKSKEKHPGSFDYFMNLIRSGELLKSPLELEDLVEMSKVPQSRRASDAELSCFVVAKRIGGKVLTDDSRAITFIRRFIQMPPNGIAQVVEILIEAYLENHLGDHDLREIQRTLADHKFVIKTDLVNESAKRRWMIGSSK